MVAGGRVPELFPGGSPVTPPPLPAVGPFAASAADRAAIDAKLSRTPHSKSSAPVGIVVAAVCAAALFAATIAVIAGRPLERHSDIERVPVNPPHLTSAPSDPGRDKLDAGRDKLDRSGGDWVERLAERSNRSVVRIATGDASGTGFVIATNGIRHLLLTNKHVLTTGSLLSDARSGVDRCRVVLTSKSSEIGRLAARATNPDVDLALVLIESDELEDLAPVGSFDLVKVGTAVVAIGDPGLPGLDATLDNTVTQGIISGKRGDMLLQTNAAINHGNSGGPLVDKYERVIGVNTLVADPRAGVQGIGFAFRADYVLRRSDWTYFIDVGDLLDRIQR